MRAHSECSTVVEQEEHAAAARALLLRKHAMVEIASAGYHKRVVRWHALGKRCMMDEIESRMPLLHAPAAGLE
jgi:hypothetical protein